MPARGCRDAASSGVERGICLSSPLEARKLDAEERGPWTTNAAGSKDEIRPRDPRIFQQRCASVQPVFLRGCGGQLSLQVRSHALEKLSDRIPESSCVV
ncbi:hypothetical protein Y1Q_0014729 [Alligator mississippiensis]|uniref:Uncharacterized protein n=1 Tax=Alligator mississippiensis TaxID=8496 RepID=A0A151P8Q6_ALLMI|nr:hypothetical protein Y1Q_0014729 [Alligator mississippiensis]